MTPDDYTALAEAHRVDDDGHPDPDAEWEGSESRRRLSIRLAALRTAQVARPVLEELLAGPGAHAWVKQAERESWESGRGFGPQKPFRTPLDYYAPVLQRGRHLPPGMRERREELAARVAVLVSCGARQRWIADVLDVDRRLVARLAREGGDTSI